MKSKLAGMIFASLCLNPLSLSVNAAQLDSATKSSPDAVIISDDEKCGSQILVDGELFMWQGYGSSKEEQEIMPLSPSYTTYKTVPFTKTFLSAQVYIVVDANTGRISNTGIKGNSSAVYLYDVYYNSNRTIAYFTVTAYTANIFGEPDSAMETTYVTVKSGGPV